jgi:hypothetical protein
VNVGILGPLTMTNLELCVIYPSMNFATA